MIQDARTYIATLTLSQDDRLAALRPDAEAFLSPEARRDGGIAELPQPSPALVPAPAPVRAAVTGAALIGFVDGLTGEEQQDVLYSHQLAERAADAAHQRHTAPADWYRAYDAVLNRIGWAGEGTATAAHAAEGDTLSLDKSALDVIGTIATGGQLAILVKALEALKGLGAGDRAVKIFELQALAQQSGSFQLGAVQRSDGGALSMAYGAFHFEAVKASKGFLFFRHKSDEVRVWAGAARRVLNRDHYSHYRQAIIDKLSADAQDYIADLPILV